MRFSDDEPGLGPGGGDELDDSSDAAEGPASSVEGDDFEQAVLYLVGRRLPRRVPAHRVLQSGISRRTSDGELHSSSDTRTWQRDSLPRLQTVKHAGPDALDRLEPLLADIRAIPGLVEKKRGIFCRKSAAFLHFHEDATGLYADARLAEDFDRYRVETASERSELLRLLRSI
jgi:hypothetical protein